MAKDSPRGPRAAGRLDLRGRRPPPPARAAGGDDDRHAHALLERILQVAVGALRRGSPTAEVFVALQRAATILPLAEGAPPTTVVRLAQDVAALATDSDLCRHLADEIGAWLDRRLAAH